MQTFCLQPSRLRFQKRSRYNSRLTPESIAISKQQNLFISKIRLDDFTQISNFDFVDNITLPRLRLFIHSAEKILNNNIMTAIFLCAFLSPIGLTSISFRQPTSPEGGSKHRYNFSASTKEFTPEGGIVDMLRLPFASKNEVGLN